MGEGTRKKSEVYYLLHSREKKKDAHRGEKKKDGFHVRRRRERANLANEERKKHRKDTTLQTFTKQGPEKRCVEAYSKRKKKATRGETKGKVFTENFRQRGEKIA